MSECEKTRTVAMSARVMKSLAFLFLCLLPHRSGEKPGMGRRASEAALDIARQLEEKEREVDGHGMGDRAEVG